MGGSIAVTMRTPDGTIHKMCRWTNILGWVVTNLRLAQKDPEHIKKVLKPWQDMRADWLKGKPYKYPMTDVYGHYDHLAPYGYGLVVIDMVNDVILSWQGYTNLETVTGASIRLSLDGRVLGEEPGDTEVDRFRALFDAGRVKGVYTYSRKTKEHGFQEFDKGYPWTFQELLEELEAHEWAGNDQIDVLWTQFVIDLSPFTVEDFEESVQGIRAMRERVIELFAEPDEEEERIWAEFIAEMHEDEEDDDAA